MAKDLKNKTVVITGAASGIGFEIADKFLQNGAKLIIILDINEKQGSEAVNNLNSKYGEHKSTFLKCDVTSDLEEVFNKIIDAYKYVDVLVNNAGILNEVAVKKTIGINVTALIEWSLKFWNHMRKDRGGNGGTIMNLASIYSFRVDQFIPVYQASKFAVMGFTKSLGFPYNFNKTGVRVVCINPGFTAETNFGSNSDPHDVLDKEQMEDMAIFMKEQLWQKPEAVAKGAVDVFNAADSGTAWLIEGSKSIEQV